MIGHGVNLFEVIVGKDNETIATATAGAVLVVLLGIAAAKKLSRKQEPIIPDERLSLSTISELIAFFIFKLGDTVMGHHNRKYLPFVGCLFLYLFSLNMLGFIPGVSMPTDYVPFNFGVALVVFVLYNYWGIKEVGLIAYLKHLWGPIFAVGFLVFPIEIISHCIRPFSLSLRLYGNMTGDHIVLGIFTDLTKVLIPVIFYCLGTFVCFMQAFVFCLLTMIYIRLAVAHEESH